MNWLRKVMNGRYGVDQLSIALLVISVILTIVGIFPKVHVFSTLAIIPMILCYLRIFSRNIRKRYEENQKFLNFWNPIRNTFKKKAERSKDKAHRLYKCPKCGKTVRVPKGKGKICITCPICKEEFIRKS
ncbi:hypothetical protein [Anaerosporobacter sp.]|uniref:hypothetical protein n=1 Tax=Anaerosporobacter sp. TaxID=1872529 RepID=UPI00286F5A6F|nr:hypothetical protein [Anaerosporobacter sp.]